MRYLVLFLSVSGFYLTLTGISCYPVRAKDTHVHSASHSHDSHAHEHTVNQKRKIKYKARLSMTS